MRDAIARPTRTATQAGLAFIVTDFIDAFGLLGADLTDRQYGALVALLGVVFSAAQVLAENAAGKGLLRDVQPSQPYDPDRDDPDDDTTGYEGADEPGRPTPPPRGGGGA